MVKLIWALIATSLLVACTPSPDTRPFPVIESEQMMQRGNQLFMQGNYSDSLYYFVRAVEQYRSLNNDSQLQAALLNTAETSLLIGRMELSKATATEAFSLQSGPSAQRAALVLTQIAMLQEDWQQAQGMLRQAEAATSANNAVATLPLVTAQLAIELGDLEEAEAALERISTATQSPLFRARAMQLEALLAAEPDTTIAQLNNALEIYQRESFRPGIASVLADLGDIYAQQGQTDEAVAHWRRALYVRTWLNDSYRAHVLLQKSEALVDGS